jgi:type I restriction enzyme S subunit
MEDIADVVGGATPKTSDPSNFTDGTIPWLTPADLSGYTAKYIGRGSRFITQKGLSSSSARMMPVGTVLFTSRAPIGYVVIASNEICTNQGFKSFVLKSKDILSDYVYWWLKGSKDLAESFASGTTFLELSGAKAKQLPIPIAPLAQQTRIVAEIEKQFSRLDEAVANLKRVRANLKRYKAAVLKAAVEGKLTEEWRRRGDACVARLAETDQGEACLAPTKPIETGAELLERILAERRANWQGRGKYKEPVGPDMSGLPELPAGWVWASAEQLASHIVDGTHHTPTYVDQGIDFISAKDVDDWKIDFSRCRKIPVAEHADLIKRCHPRPGHVLVTKSGTIGRVAIVKIDKPFSLFESVAVIPLLKPISPEFVGYAVFSTIQGEFGKKWQKGVAVRHLHLEDLRRLPIPLPPLKEQEKIVEEFERLNTVAENIEKTIEAELIRADRLRQSILKQAFSGQLAPQDPNDEPASVLLERIRVNVSVGATHASPGVRTEKTKRARHASPLRKPKPLPMVAETIATYGDAIAARILTAMQPGGEYARADLAEPLGLTTGQWNAAIQELKRRGQVRQVGEKRGAKYLIGS